MERPNATPEPNGTLEGILRGGKKIIVRKDTRPYTYKVSIENTCKKAIPVAYGNRTYAERDVKVRTWGWNSLKPGLNIIDFPEMGGAFTIYLKRGELFRIMKSRKLQPREHNTRTLFSLLDDKDFDVAYNYSNPPNIPNLQKARFATITGGFNKNMNRFKIKKCRKKRKKKIN